LEKLSVRGIAIPGAIGQILAATLIGARRSISRFRLEFRLASTCRVPQAANS